MVTKEERGRITADRTKLYAVEVRQIEQSFMWEKKGKIVQKSQRKQQEGKK